MSTFIHSKGLIGASHFRWIEGEVKKYRFQKQFIDMIYNVM